MANNIIELELAVKYENVLERIAVALEKLTAAKLEVREKQVGPIAADDVPPVMLMPDQLQSPIEEKPKRGRKAKELETLPLPGILPEAPIAPCAESFKPEVGIEEAREQLKNYALSKGKDRAKVLLAEFKAEKLSELNAEQRFYMCEAIAKDK